MQLRLDFAPPLAGELPMWPSMRQTRRRMLMVPPPAHTPEEPDREQNTQLTYPKLIHFLVSLLCMECWPEFYSPSCLVLPLWEKKDVFCDKKDSELSECHVF